MRNKNAKWAMVIVGLMLNYPACAEELSENQARLGQITGDVGLLSQGALEWIEPQVGLPLDIGDHLRTGEEGRVEILTGDNVLWVLAPQSEIVLERMVAHTGLFNLVSGTLQGILDSARLAGIPQDWIFNTPAASVAVRGTDFVLIVSKALGTRLAVFEGMVEMEPAETAEGKQPPVRVSRHQEALAARGKSIQLSSTYSADVRPWEKERRTLKNRLRVNQNTWSPFTPSVRKELRLKYVQPVTIRKKAKPAATPSRKKRKQDSH